MNEYTVKLRAEVAADYEAVAHVVRSAFGRETEVKLVEEIRKNDDFTQELSLVAVAMVVSLHLDRWRALAYAYIESVMCRGVVREQQ